MTRLTYPSFIFHLRRRQPLFVYMMTTCNIELFQAYIHVHSDTNVLNSPPTRKTLAFLNLRNVLLVKEKCPPLVLSIILVKYYHLSLITFLNLV